MKYIDKISINIYNNGVNDYMHISESGVRLFNTADMR